MKSLSFFKDQQLSMNEMKAIKGGLACGCRCSDGSGQWSGTYGDASQVTTAIDNYCDGEGSCVCNPEL